MRSKLSLILLLVAILPTGCMPTQSIQPDTRGETVKMFLETPAYFFNIRIPFHTLLIFAPIKSYRILKGSDTANTALNISSGNLMDMAVNNSRIFRYKDLGKYRSLTVDYDSPQTYGSSHSYMFRAVIEVELYRDEITPEFLNGEQEEEPLTLKSLEWCIYFADGYNGTISPNKIENPEKGSPDEKEIYKLIDDDMSKLDLAAFNRFINSRQSTKFKEVARSIRNGWTSDSTYDKAKSIYDWVSKNISYNDNLDRSFKISADQEQEEPQRPFSLSVQRTLEEGNTQCIGYSFLFHALAQYFGIESKVIQGFGKGTGKDGLHAWNVVTDKETGKNIYVDCTYGHTDPGNNFVYASNAAFLQKHFVWANDEKTVGKIPFEIDDRNK